METVRNGQRVAPYCSVCGCRLAVCMEYLNLIAFEHYDAWADRDARGCQCSLIQDWWWVSKEKVYD